MVATTFARGRLSGSRTSRSPAATSWNAWCAPDAEPDAEEALTAFEGLARRADRTGALALAARCRGLMADDDAFEPPFEEAFRLHRDVDAPFEEARTLPLPGRAPAPGDAALGRPGAPARGARPVRGLGAVDWAATARGELGVTGETAAPRSGPRSDALTPQELQVALMVASGATNREAGVPPVPVRQDDRGPPGADLPQARRALPDRARRPCRHDGLDADGTRDAAVS